MSSVTVYSHVGHTDPIAKQLIIRDYSVTSITGANIARSSPLLRRGSCPSPDMVRELEEIKGFNLVGMAAQNIDRLAAGKHVEMWEVYAVRCPRWD